MGLARITLCTFSSGLRPGLSSLAPLGPFSACLAQIESHHPSFANCATSKLALRALYLKNSTQVFTRLRVGLVFATSLLPAFVPLHEEMSHIRSRALGRRTFPNLKISLLPVPHRNEMSHFNGGDLGLLSCCPLNITPINQRTADQEQSDQRQS